MNRRHRCTADPIRPRGDQNGNGLREHPERVGDLRRAERKLGEVEEQDAGGHLVSRMFPADGPATHPGNIHETKLLEDLCDVEVPSKEIFNYEDEDGVPGMADSDGEGEVVEITEEEAE